MTDAGKRFTGKVVWFNSKKGFGFLTCDQDGKEYFCHYTQLRMEGFKELVADQSVSYGIGKNNRGPMAVDVEVEGEPEGDEQ
jgi:cold shock protein